MPNFSATPRVWARHHLYLRAQCLRTKCFASERSGHKDMQRMMLELLNQLTGLSVMSAPLWPTIKSTSHFRVKVPGRVFPRFVIIGRCLLLRMLTFAEHERLHIRENDYLEGGVRRSWRTNIFWRELREVSLSFLSSSCVLWLKYKARGTTLHRFWSGLE